MRRKVVGFLLLAAIVCAGIVFVEVKSGKASRVASGTTNDALFTAVIGGSPPRADNASDTELPKPPVADDGGEVPVRPPPDPQPPEPRFAQDGDPPTNELTHTVRSGDTLTRIAQDYFGSNDASLIDRIASRNALRAKNSIRPGDKLVIPVERFDVHVATGAESLAEIAQAKFGSNKSLAPIIRFNPKLGSTPSSRPAKGTRVFIPR